MTAKIFRWLAFGFLASCFTISSYYLNTQARPASPGLTVHEWGTFTSVAGKDGRALEWLPLTGSTDLPGFVEHFRNASFKLGLRGTVRMETPVLYFYSSRAETLSVKVAFSKGVITEWYPHANRVEPVSPLTDVTLNSKHADGSIAWDSVTLVPGAAADFPRENRGNHYYAARETASTPLRVSTSAGDQKEKFLFYRGVSTLSVPISVMLTPDGGLQVKNAAKEEIPGIIYFERRGEKMGYGVVGAVQNETTLNPPALTGTVDSLGRDMETVLVAQGLYRDEAHAMLETWKNTWFEEGSRLLYIVPSRFVDEILPLSISPAPSKTVRVFVGRLELVTPETERAVLRAFAAHDNATLGKYGRFLEPILESMITNEPNPARVRKLQAYLNSFYNSEIVRAQQRN